MLPDTIVLDEKKVGGLGKSMTGLLLGTKRPLVVRLMGKHCRVAMTCELDQKHMIVHTLLLAPLHSMLVHRFNLCLVLIVALAWQTVSAIQCNTTGNAGQYGNLIKSVLVDFQAPVSTNYTANELAACFYVTFSSGRYLIIETAEIMSGTVVNITFRHAATGDWEMQTGASLNVSFTPLSGITRKLLVNGVEQAQGVMCASTTDKTSPALIRAMEDTTFLIPHLLFSEPVERCGGGNLLLSDFTLTGITGCDAEFVPVGTPPTTVWYVTCTDITSGKIAMSAGAACDAAGNTAIASSERTLNTENSLYNSFLSSQNYAQKLYDLDRDGMADAVSIQTSWAVYNEFVNMSNLAFRISSPVTSIDISNPVFFAEDSAIDNSVFVRFDNLNVIGVGQLQVRCNATDTIVFSPPTGIASANGHRTFFDRIPPFVVSAVTRVGSNQVLLTVSEPYTTTLASSQFDVISSDGITITGSTGTPATTQINLTLSDSLTTALLSDIKFFLKLQEFSSAYSGLDLLGHGRPLWTPVAPTAALLGGYMTRLSALDGWDTLVVNFSSPLTDDDVSTSNLLVAATGYTFTVTAASLLTDYDVRYTISYECTNSSQTCASTSNAGITFSITGDSVIDPSFALTPNDQVGPLPIAVVGIVGHNSLRLVFSEPIAFDDSLVSQSVPFEVHSNGLTVTAVVPNATNSATYDLTLSRTLRSSDTSALLSSGVVTSLVDTTGNVGSALFTRSPFILSATAHDDDDDGFVDRIRLQTTLSHQEFTSSGGFQTPLAFTFGEVTRVDANTTDIAVANGPAVEEGIVIEYVSGTLNMRIVSSDGVRSGIEMIRATFPVFSSLTVDDDVPTTNTTTTIIVEEQEGMAYGLAGGLIACAFVVGLALAYAVCSRKPSVINTRGKHIRRVPVTPTSDSSDVELFES